jgi:ABC-2 type transport system permease protein
MRKYLEAFRLSFKMQITWRFDVAMTMLSTAGQITAAWIIWQVIFSRNTTVKGFGLGSMLSYYLISSILTSIDFTNQISGEVSDLIRGGRFSGHMVIPMNPLFFFGSMTAGESAFHLGFSLLTALICAALFQMNIAITTDPARIVLALAMVVIGLFFMASYHYTIGVLTFKFLEIGFFMHVQGSIIAFVTGALVPLSLLPENVLYTLRFLPFTHVVFTPAMLLCGLSDTAEGVTSLAVISVWAFIMFMISQYAYKHLRVKYDGVGI